MSTEPQPLVTSPSTPPSSPQTERALSFSHRLIAPLWHTLVILIIILGLSYLGSSRVAQASSYGSRIGLYLQTLIGQALIVLFIWFGLWLRKSSLRELIGGRWNTFEDFLLDGAFALGFWVASAAVVVGLKFALGLASLNNKANTEAAKQSIGAVVPHNVKELVVFVLLVVFVGFAEEIIFRGYLQKQLGAITGVSWVGIILSAAVFGAGHGYQGTRLMVVLGIYGALFGVLAYWRKNLRPGMMAHAWQDAFSGAAYFVLTKMGLV